MDHGQMSGLFLPRPFSRVSCSSGWLQTPYVLKNYLELRVPASLALGLWAHTITSAYEVLGMEGSAC